MTLACNVRTAPHLFIFQMNLTSKINHLSSIITLMISSLIGVTKKVF